MEWSDICLIEESVIATIETLGFQRIDPLSHFWGKDEEWVHLSVRPDDGFTMKVNGEEKFHIGIRGCHGKNF